ncbi:hypothetical protein Pelo_8240 [Pelomyxa schiedti]|nr:hypothetical protein Pelo_8240 [Pelomyxa schiedti]
MGSSLSSKQRESLNGEGILFCAESVTVRLNYNQWRSPGARVNQGAKIDKGCIVLTNARLLCTDFTRAVINMPISDPRFKTISFGTDDEGHLKITLEADKLFGENGHGTLVLRYSVEAAQFQGMLGTLLERPLEAPLNTTDTVLVAYPVGEFDFGAIGEENGAVTSALMNLTNGS